MASAAHCLYCFEVLSASLEKRRGLELKQVEELWAQYIRASAEGSKDGGEEQDRGNGSDGDDDEEEQYPLFVTWDKFSSYGHKSLRGCIGTFDAKKLSSGLRSFAKTSAFEDVRFSPITLSELPSLHNQITLLLDFEPCADALDWELAKHGIRISFTNRGKRYSATYLPFVAVEQGWTKQETVISLMRKAGWNGRTNEVTDLKCIRYQGKEASVSYNTWRDWRVWAETKGLISARQ